MFNALFYIVSIAYPFCILFSTNLVYISSIMAILWAIRAYRDREYRIFGIVLSLLFIIIAIFDMKDLSLFYPVIINVLFFMLFFFSLKGEAVITKMARLRHKDLSNEAIFYTRRLTMLWCYFFIANGFVSLLLAIFASKEIWALYCGVISYILIGLFFGIEIIYRKVIKGV